MVILYHSFIIYEKKKIRKKLLMKKLCINKGMWKREWMMNGENEMKRKEGWKRYNVMWRKERIGGWGLKWKICTPLVKWFWIKPYSFFIVELTYLVAPLHPWEKTSWFVQLYNLSRGD